MKQHLKLLAKVPDIDAFLALNALLPFETTYNSDDTTPGVLRVVDSPEGQGRSLTCVIDSHAVVMHSTLTNDQLTIQANKSTIHAKDICDVLAAMGMQAVVAGEHIAFKAIDAEGLYLRLAVLDSAWCLMRRIRTFNSDQRVIAEAAQTLLSFANEWLKNRLAATEAKDLGPRFEKQTQQLEARALAFSEWGVPGLNKLTLNSDPRGSMLELTFEGFHPMCVCASVFDWAIGKTVAQAMADSNRKTRFGKYEVRPTRIDDDVQGVLNGLIVIGNEVKIVDQLPNKLYDKVNLVLSTIGGEWSTTRAAHVFDVDPTPMLDQLVETGEVLTRKDYEYFPTQPPLASRTVQVAQLKAGMLVLEPQAGQGALAMQAAEIVGRDKVTCYELMPENVLALKKLGFAISEPSDFLEVTPNPIYDRVIANPPFSGGRDVAHTLHAWKFVKPGGKLVTIASTQWQTHDTRPAADFREFLRKYGAQIEQVEQGAFKAAGTNVATTLIAITKPVEVSAPQPSAAKPQAVIDDLFANLL